MFLSGKSLRNARDRERDVVERDAQPPQLRGSVKLSLPRPSRIKDIVLTLVGESRTDWPEGLGQNRLEMTEREPIVKIETSLFRSGSGIPKPPRHADAPHAHEEDAPKTVAQPGAAQLAPTDEMHRDRLAGSSLASRASSASSSAMRRMPLRGLLDGLRLPAAERNAHTRSSAPRADEQVSAPAPAAPAAPGGTSGTGNGAAPGRSASPPQSSAAEWFELRRGEYEYPFSWSLPPDLPPTLHADFGHIEYTLRATVSRSGPLTLNLTNHREVTLVQAPDTESTEETDPIIVERTCEDTLSYMVVVSGRSFAIGTQIPLWLKFVPIGKIRIHRVTVALEEQTDYYANARRIVRRELPRKWTLLRLQARPGDLALLPITSEAPEALATSPLAPLVNAAARMNVAEEENIRMAPLDPLGPWELAANLSVSMEDLKKINISSTHARSNISVQHSLKIVIRVERPGPTGDAAAAAPEAQPAAAPPTGARPSAGSRPASRTGNSTPARSRASSESGAPPGTSGGATLNTVPLDAPNRRRMVDIVVGIPIMLTHSHTSLEWISLPSYESVQTHGSRILEGGALTPPTISADVRVPPLTPGEELGPAMGTPMGPPPPPPPGPPAGPPPGTQAAEQGPPAISPPSFAPVDLKPPPPGRPGR